MSHMTNPLVTPEQIYKRSQFSNLPTDLQDSIFYSTQCLTQAAGQLLQLSQSVTAQANVVLARYWLVEPVLAYEFSDVSAATLFTVAKAGPSPRGTRDVANVYTYLLSTYSPLLRSSTASPPPKDRPDDPKTYTLTDSAYQAFHSRLLALEARILYALGFDTHVALPHPLAVTYLQALDFLGTPKEAIARRAVDYMNAALLSPQLLYLTHQPHALAVAAVYNAAKDVGAKMPETAWWEVFDVEREELGFLVVGMRSLEGWVRKMREEGGWLAKGSVLTKKGVLTELERAGVKVDGGAVVDEETEMMRRMDERMASIGDP
ncbi:cyclin domain-containing protein [Thozetella sp. PMI_491]|nr:cyclin domain-containing protein [Thozetella sp. PMI_491]